MAEYLDSRGLLHLLGKLKDIFARKSEAVKTITRSGTTFTATRADGSKFTFTQQAIEDEHTYINVLDYGAKGDGTTDDTAAFNAAFAAAHQGSQILIPFGGGEKYRITSAVTLNASFVTVYGEGGSNLSWQHHGIKFEPATETSVCFRVYGSGCVFENLVISTDDDAEKKGIGIYARMNSAPDTDIEVLNCKFTKLHHGVFSYNRGCLVRNSSFAICWTGVSISADENLPDTGVKTQRAIRIENNRFHLCSSGIRVNNTAHPYYMVVSGNYIDYHWGQSDSSESSCLLYASCDFNGLTITNNTVADPRLHAIYVGGTVTKFTMVGNNIFSYLMNSSSAVRITMVDKFCIGSNIVMGSRGAAFYFDTMRDGCFTGNYVLGRVETDTDSVIRVATKLDRVAITGNNLLAYERAGSYMLKYLGTEPISYLVIQGNSSNAVTMFGNANNAAVNHSSIQATL